MKLKNNFIWLLIIVLIFLSFILANTNAVRANLFSKSTPESIRSMQSNQLKSDLSKAQDPETVKAIQEKLAPIEYALNTQSTAQAQNPVSIQEICANRSPVANTYPQLELGILPVREDFLATQNLKINNIFRGLYQGQIVEVYAGKNYNNDLNGVIIVSIESLNINKYYYDPSPTGSLEIINEKDLRLELRSEDGTIRWFDIPAMQFISSPNVDIPAANLPPTPTPFQNPCAQFDTP